MKISSREESTIDYPGEFGQILFCPGCSFRCGFCHNPQLFEETRQIDTEFLLKDIKVKAAGGWYRAICLSGGEPTLQNDLAEFTKKLKEMKILVKVDTNGSRPQVVQELLDNKSVDYVAMDIKTSFERYEEIAGVKVNLDDIKKSIELVKQFPIYEFRTTVLPNLNKEDFEKMGKAISNNGENKARMWTIQQFVCEFAYTDEYKNMTPKSKEEIQEIAKICEKYADEVRVIVD
jgi:pyruvate formate lyase activating enzyme